MTSNQEVRSGGARDALLGLHETHPAFDRIRDAARRIVPGEGPIGARVMFIGEAPGSQEDIEGRPFVGPSGELLGEWLDEIGLSRPHQYITNVLKYRPPNNRLPTPVERHAARPLLLAEIRMVGPELVVLLGATPLATMFPGHKLTRHRGQFLQTPANRFLVMNHPAAGLRSDELDRVARQDIRRIREECPRCNHDRHQCPGCGEPVPHGTVACAGCDTGDLPPKGIIVYETGEGDE